MSDEEPEKTDDSDQTPDQAAADVNESDDTASDQSLDGEDTLKSVDETPPLDQSSEDDTLEQVLEFDPKLLSLMIGELGIPDILEDKAQQILRPLAQVLMMLFKDSNNLEIDASMGDFKHGKRSELLTEISGDFAYCESDIETWSDDIAIICSSNFIIGLVECLLGGDDPDSLVVDERALSDLELNMSKVFFEVATEALKATITRNPKLEINVATPQMRVPDIKNEAFKEYFAASMSLEVVFGAVETSLTIIIPQSILLKTDINANAGRRRRNDEETPWTKKLSKQVYNSSIPLEASIQLEAIKLRDVGRLQVGDVLRFKDELDPVVTLNANGRDLFSCALGKAGQRYMVRVETPCGDEDWKEDL